MKLVRSESNSVFLSAGYLEDITSLSLPSASPDDKNSLSSNSTSFLHHKKFIGKERKRGRKSIVRFLYMVER